MVYLEIPWENKESSLCTSIKNTIIDFIQTSKLNNIVFFLNSVFFLQRRENIIQILKCCYGKHTKKNLPVFDIKEANLKGYTTTEKNKKQLIDKYPPEDFRNFSEDLIPEER